MPQMLHHPDDLEIVVSVRYHEKWLSAHVVIAKDEVDKAVRGPEALVNDAFERIAFAVNDKLGFHKGPLDTADAGDPSTQ